MVRFLDQLEGEIPAGQEVIAISDNLSTRTTQEVEDWLAEHSFVFTPKHASWLNQVEIFFSILARRLLKHGAFVSEDDLARRSDIRRGRRVRTRSGGRRGWRESVTIRLLRVRSIKGENT